MKWRERMGMERGVRRERVLLFIPSFSFRRSADLTHQSSEHSNMATDIDRSVSWVEQR